ncbi:MAG: hypothetical protein ACP5IV_07820, partial [Caldisericia bacterium]
MISEKVLLYLKGIIIKRVVDDKNFKYYINFPYKQIENMSFDYGQLELYNKYNSLKVLKENYDKFGDVYPFLND